jgi:Mce-associated membrane protein
MTDLPRTDEQAADERAREEQAPDDQARDAQARDDQVPDGSAPTDPAAAARPRPTPSPGPTSGTRPTPGARPSPTSRARRTAAGAPDALRRPRPAPLATPAEVGSLPGNQDGQAPVGPVASSVNIGKDTETEAVERIDTPLAGSSEAPESRPPAGSRRRAPAWLAAVLVVLLLALAALDGWMLTHQPSSGSKSEREQALSTAKTAVPLILSYDYRHFDSDVGAARGRLTGRAVDDYVQAMAKSIKPTAAKVHAVVQAQTDGAGVEAVSGNGKQVTVVVFGEQKVTNTSVTAPRIDLFRVRVTLDLVAGQWLVSKFDQI